MFCLFSTRCLAFNGITTVSPFLNSFEISLIITLAIPDSMTQVSDLFLGYRYESFCPGVTSIFLA